MTLRQRLTHSIRYKYHYYLYRERIRCVRRRPYRSHLIYDCALLCDSSVVLTFVPRYPWRSYRSGPLHRRCDDDSSCKGNRLGGLFRSYTCLRDHASYATRIQHLRWYHARFDFLRIPEYSYWKSQESISHDVDSRDPLHLAICTDLAYEYYLYLGHRILLFEANSGGRLLFIDLQADAKLTSNC